MTNLPTPSNLSASQIIKATGIAFFSAVFIALVAVLPAEYGKDYTGLGQLLGFSRLYQTDETTKQKAPETDRALVQVFKEITLNNVGSGPDAAKPIEADKPAPNKQYEIRKDSLKISVPAEKGLEYKIAVLKYGQVKYAWKTDKGVLFLDLHGDVKTSTENSPYFESYTVAYSNNMAGSFIAPFEGKHGWYFRNKSNHPIEVTLYLQGEYQLIDK